MDHTKNTIQIFNSHAQRYTDKYFDVKKYATSLDLFIAKLASSTSSVLDVGCGPGNISSYLLNKKPNLNITGIDLAPQMIALAQQHIPQGQFKVMDGRNVAQIEQQFDAVVCSFCLPYLSMEETAELFEAFSEVIKNHGVLYLSWIEGSYDDSGYIANPSEEKEQLFTYYHEWATINKSLQNNGFRIVNKEMISNVTGDNEVVVIATYEL